MIYQTIPFTFRSNLLITVLALGIFTGACSNSEQQKAAGESSTTASSTASTMVQGGGEFEGIITMAMNTEDQKGMEMIYSLKGTRSRIEMKLPGMSEAQGTMLMDIEGGKVTTLIPQRKMYMTMDVNQTADNVKEAAKGMKGSVDEEDAKFPKLTSTGKKETIAGYTCEHWLMGDKQDMDICVAKGLGYFGMGSQMGGESGSSRNLLFNAKLLAEAAAHPEWLRFLQGGAFPLKLSTLEGGKVKMSMQVTKVERKSIDDSLFAIPPGYKEFNMQKMMGGAR